MINEAEGASPRHRIRCPYPRGLGRVAFPLALNPRELCTRLQEGRLVGGVVWQTRSAARAGPTKTA